MGTAEHDPRRAGSAPMAGARSLQVSQRGSAEQSKEDGLGGSFMNRWLATLPMVLLCATVLAQDGDEVRLDNPNLEGWHAHGSGVWEWRDEAIWCNGEGGGWLRSDRIYTDFTLRFEYKIEPRGNSGVWLRAPIRGRASSVGFEFQILGTRADNPSNHSTGSLYDLLAPEVEAGRPAGEWNQVEVTCIGSRVRAVLNNVELYDVDLREIEENETIPLGRKPRERSHRGYIGLTNHGAQVWYRQVYIQEHPQEGFHELPLGEELGGWSVRGDEPQPEAYSVDEGTLSARASEGSILASDEVVEDYTLRLRYRTSPGAEGLLHIRFDEDRDRYVLAIALADDEDAQPSDTASGALYEYGAPRYVNSLPTGEWNDLEIVYRGWDLSVWLNGSPVLDGSLLWYSGFNGQPRRGAIGIEALAGEIEFSQIQVGPAPEE